VADRPFIPPALRGWLHLALQVLLGATLFLVLQLLATRHNQRFDLTPTESFALSGSARQVAESFARPARLTIFYNGQGGDARRDMADLLEQFHAAAPDLTYRMFDLDRSPALAGKYNVTSYNSGVLEVGDELVRLRAIDEAEITAALISLSRTRPRGICFLIGHGERSPNDDDERAGYSKLRSALERERFTTEALTTLPRDGVPAECTVMVLAGPSKELLPGEAGALLRFLRAGGKGLLLVDPDAPPSVLALLREAGVDARTELIVDEQNRFVGADSFMPQVVRFRSETFRNTLTAPAVLSVARPVGALEEKPPGMQVISIAGTSPESWALVGATTPPDDEPQFRPQEDTPGPLSVGVLATFPPPAPEAVPGQLMVFGDSDFATNFHLDLLGNRDLILSAVAALAEDPALIAVRRKSQPSAGTLGSMALTAAQSRTVFWASVVVAPLTMLLVGTAVGLRRLRQRGGR